MKNFKKVMSLVLCIFVLCGMMTLPVFAEGEAAMLAASGDIGDQIHWEFDENTGTLTLSKPDEFTGKWTNQYYNYINYAKVDGGKVVDVPSTNVSDEVTAGKKVYKVACPWGKYTFNTTAESDGSYMAASVDYTHIKKIVIGEGIENVAHYAFCTSNATGSPSHTAATEVVFPTSIKWIGNLSFKKVGLTSLNLENTSLEKIWGSAFQDCPIAGKVVMPKTLTELGASAFRTWDGKCGAITQFIVPAESTITSIGDGTFDGQDKLEYVVLPASVTSIGNYAFRKYNANAVVKNIIFLGDAPTISTGITPFADTTKIYYSDKATGWDSAAVTTNTGLKSENISKMSGIPSTFTDFGVFKTGGCFWFYDSASKTLDICGAVGSTANLAHNYRPWSEAICTEVENVNINDGVDLPSSVYCFKYWNGGTGGYDHPNIKTMYIGKDVKKVPNQFMNAQNLTKLTFSPESKLTEIVGNAFLNHQLEELILPDTVEVIGDQAFDMYSSQNIKLKKLYLGKSLTTIGNYAFRKCKSLESVVIPATVTSIGTNAFTNESSATTGLKVVYFEGTIPENALSVDTNNVTTVFNNNYQAQFYVTNSSDVGKVFAMSAFTKPTTKLMPESKIDANMTLAADGTATAKIYDFSGVAKKYDLFVASYDGDVLNSVSLASSKDNVGTESNYAEISVKNADGNVRAFLWDKDLTPYAPSIN